MCNFLLMWVWVCGPWCFGMKKSLRNTEGLCIHDGGDEGNRTPDLLTASQALSQLSYAPVRRSTIRELGRRCKDNFGKTFRGAGAGVPRGRASLRSAWPPHGPYAGRLGARSATLPAQPDFLCVASPIIGSDCEPSLIRASELCRFTTMNLECSTTHVFSLTVGLSTCCFAN